MIDKVEEKLREIQEKRGKEKENREKKKQAGKVDLVGIFGDPSKLLKHHWASLLLKEFSCIWEA